MLLFVKVVPKASHSAIVGWEEDALKIRIKAVPEKGEANHELIRFLAETLNIPKSWISITHGLASRKKIVRIENLSEEQVRQKLKHH